MFLPILAALGSAASHPFYPIYARKGAHPLTVNFWGILLATLLFSFCFFSFQFWQDIALSWKLIVLSSLFHFAYIIMSLTLIAKHEFQVLYPLTRLAPVLILLGEMFLLGSDFSFLQIVGVVAVTSGALIFGFDKKIASIRLTVLFSVLAMAVFVTGFHLTDKKLLEFFSPSEMWALIAFQIPLHIWVIFWRKKEAFADLKNYKNLFKFEVAAVLNWYLALWAMQFLSATVVFSIRNLSILFGVFLGARLFHEGHKLLRYAAAVLIVVGAAMTVI